MITNCSLYFSSQQLRPGGSKLIKGSEQFVILTLLVIVALA